MVKRVYTRTGDDGTTGLVGGSRALKDSHRVEACGAVDELNAALGLVQVALGASRAGGRLAPILARIQNELLHLGTELATPDEVRPERSPTVAARQVEALEREIDDLNEGLPELTSFIAPGNGEVPARLHLARVVCRRAERRVVTLAHGESIREDIVSYLNRLSDALFVLARWAAHKDDEGETLQVHWT